MTRVYESSSGDTWDIVSGQNGEPMQVRHTPNKASGGKVSDIALEDFLQATSESPEHQAVVAYLNEAAVAPLRGYIHDPKEKGGPYIAVVLTANDEPTVTLHNSYAEAERELEAKLADQKQVILAHRSRSE